jgi:hypothetical protein
MNLVATGALAKSGNDVRLTWATTSGVTYHVQYTTSLSPANWLNLTTPFVASNGVSTLVDTNALKNSNQRYYRLVSP